MTTSGLSTTSRTLRATAALRAVRRGAARERRSQLLAVEVLPSSTRSVDLLLKHALYAESGVAAYWVVDPLVPLVRAWTLGNESHVDAGFTEGEQSLHLERPFPVTVVPQERMDL